MFDNIFNNQSKGSKHILPKQLQQGRPEAKTVDWALTVLSGVVAVGGGILSLVAGLRAADQAYANWDAKQQQKK